MYNEHNLHYRKSLMFAGLIFAFLRQNYVRGDKYFVVSSGHVNYLGTHELCLRVFIFAI